MTVRSRKLQSTLGYYGLFVCLGLSMAIVGPTLRLLACRTGSTAEAMGWLFFTGSTGYTVGTLLGGRLFDRVRRGHALLGGSELVAAALLALVPAASSLWLLLALVFCRGLLEGMVNTGGNTLLLWTHGEAASPYINGLHFSFGVGAFLAPLVVAAFLGPGASADAACAAAGGGIGWRGAYWAVAAFAAAASLWVLLLPGSPDPAAHVAAARRRGGAGAAMRYGPIAVAAVYLFAYVGAEISFGNWIASYAIDLGIADARAAALLTSAFWAAFTVGRLVSIPVALRCSPRQVIPVALGGCLLVSGLLAALPLSTALLWTAAAGLGLCMAPLWPSGYTLAGQVVALTGTTSALVLLGDSFGAMVLPSLTGRIMAASQAGGPGRLAASLPLLVFASLLVCLGTYVALAAAWRRRGRGDAT